MGEIYLLRNTAATLYKTAKSLFADCAVQGSGIESVIPSRDIIRVLDIVLASPLVELSCTLGS